MPTWALTLAFWLHMAATIVWIGGLFYHSAILTPTLSRSLSPVDLARNLALLRRRFNPLAWLSLAVLVATGLIQMSANPSYDGFLSIANRWASAILAKHLATAAMVVLAAYQTWYLQPQLERRLLLGSRPEGESAGVNDLSRRQGRLMQLNLLLGLLVLALTAVARTA